MHRVAIVQAPARAPEQQWPPLSRKPLSDRFGGQTSSILKKDATVGSREQETTERVAFEQGALYRVLHTFNVPIRKLVPMVLRPVAQP